MIILGEGAPNSTGGLQPYIFDNIFQKDPIKLKGKWDLTGVHPSGPWIRQ